MRLVILYSLRWVKPVLVLALSCCSFGGDAWAADWNSPAQQLARKIVAITGPGAVAATVENRSSLAKKDADAISSLLHAALESLGARPAKPEQAASVVSIWLSENPISYVWVAEIHQGADESSVVMVSAPREDGALLARDSTPLTLRKLPLWAQEDRILDVLVLEEDSAPKQIAVLDGERVAIYRSKNGKWQQEQILAITHVRPWPRDLRGRLMMPSAKDHLLDVYLPGVLCRSTSTLPLTLTCRESDDPWPLNQVSLAVRAGVQPLNAFYSASRNFFTGALAPGVGKLSTVGKFYSAATLPRDKYDLWLFAEADGQIHLVDGVTDQPAKLGWGSDVASVRTACRPGWLLLATGAGDAPAENAADSVRAYEIADRDPAPVSEALNFPGRITALWTEAKDDSVIAVVRNRESGEYEAFRVAVGCGQ
jgi:hypothetical protein